MTDETALPWCHGMAECFDCDHAWTAVWPLGANALECPRCGSTNTDRDPGGDE
jgi:Zn finger protein HypA/HybF involved in hydrogenase expression